MWLIRGLSMSRLIVCAVSRCPLCGGKADRLPPLPSTGGVYSHCRRCDLIHAHKRDLLSPADERARYTQHDNTLENTGYVQMLEEFLIQSVFPFVSGGRALEFGCGPGPVLAHLLRRHGFTVDVYDPFFFPHRDFLAHQYDLVTSTEVLEHLRKPAETLDTLCSVLAPQGVLAVMTHLHPGVNEFPAWWYHRDPTHIAFFSERTLRWISHHWPLKLVFTDTLKMASYRRHLDRRPKGGPSAHTKDSDSESSDSAS